MDTGRENRALSGTVANRGKAGLGRVLITTVFCVLLIVYIGPLYYVVLTSFSAAEPGSQMILGIIPTTYKLDAYRYLMDKGTIVSAFFNSFIITILGTALNIAMTTVTGFVLSKKFPGSKLILQLIVFTMFFSGGIIPYFLVVKSIPGMMNSLAVMIVPLAMQTYYLLIMITYFKTVPASLEESARIDGGGELTLLLRIVVPVSLPTIAAITLFYAVDRWNEWYHAMLFVYQSDKYPLQYLLREAMLSIDVLTKSGMSSMAAEFTFADRNIQMAIVVIASLPILCVYPLLQRFFVSGIMIGSMKE